MLYLLLFISLIFVALIPILLWKFRSHSVVMGGARLASMVTFAEELPTIDDADVKIWERIDLQPNDVLREMYRHQSVRDKDNNPIKYTSGVSPREGYHLYDIVKQNDDITTVVEVGMAFGTTALYICQAFKDAGRDGTLISIDPNQSTQWSNIGRLNLERAGLDKYHQLMEESSITALPKLLMERGEGSLDLAFVDGMHLFDYTLLDIFYAVKLLRIGGVLVVDDIRHSGVKQVISYIRSNYANPKKNQILEYQSRTPTDQTAGTFVKIAEDTRAWDFHVGFT